MSTSSTLKLALELAAKVTGREDLAALAGEVQELGPISDETAAEALTQLEQASVLTDQERLLASEIKQLERQLISQSAAHTRLHVGLTQAGLDSRNLAQEQQLLQRERGPDRAAGAFLGAGGARHWRVPGGHRQPDRPPGGHGRYLVRDPDPHHPADGHVPVRRPGRTARCAAQGGDGGRLPVAKRLLPGSRASPRTPRCSSMR